MAKNTYKQDEILEEPFDIRHLLRASSYIKKYQKRMICAHSFKRDRRSLRLCGSHDHPAGSGRGDPRQKFPPAVFSGGSADRASIPSA